MWQGENGQNVLELVCKCVAPTELLKYRLVNHAWNHSVVRSPSFPRVKILNNWEREQRRRPFAGLQVAKNFYMHGVRVQRKHDGVLFWHRYWPVIEPNLVSLEMFNLDIDCWQLTELVNACASLETLILNKIKFKHQPTRVLGAAAAAVPEKMHRIYCQHEQNAIPRVNPPTITKLVLKNFQHTVIPNCLCLVLAARCEGRLKELENSGHTVKSELRPAFLPNREQVNAYLFQIIRQNADNLKKLSVFGNTYGHELLETLRANRHVHIQLDHVNVGNILPRKDHSSAAGRSADFIRFVQDQQNVHPLQSLELTLETVGDPAPLLQTIRQCTSLKKLVLAVQKSDDAIDLSFLKRLPGLKQLVVNEPRLARPGAEAFDPEYLNHPSQDLRKLTIGHRISDGNTLQAALGLDDYALLTELAIAEGDRVTDAVCQTILHRLTALEKLCINNAPNLTDSGLTGLHIDMINIILKNKDYQVMYKAESMLPRVDGLNIKNQLRSLWSLNLKGCNRVSDVTLFLGVKFPRLTEINVSYLTSVTDLGLNWLCQNNPKLTKLVCKHNRNVTHFGLNFILRRFSTKLVNIHITKEIGERKLEELPYAEHPSFGKIVSTAPWNEAR